MNDERNMQRRIVDEEPMRLLAMLAEAFSVIAAEDNQCALLQTFVLQKFKQTSNLCVRECDFAIIRTISVFFAVRSWRAIGIVRVVEMHPKEELLLIILAQPIERDIGHNVAGAFHFIEIRFLQAVENKVGGVEIETNIQAQARIEDARTEDGRSRIPGGLHHPSQTRLRWTVLSSR